MILNINIFLILLCATWQLAITKHVSLQEQNIGTLLLDNEIKELRHFIVKRVPTERKVISEHTTIGHHANHPPLKENDEQIPVSVVYEDNPQFNTTKSKNSRPSGSRNIKPKQTTDKDVTIESEKHTTKKVMLIEDVAENNKSDVKNKLNEPSKLNTDTIDVKTKQSDSDQVKKTITGNVNKKENPTEDIIQIPVVVQYDSNIKGSTETRLNDNKSEHHITKNDAKVADDQINKKVPIAETSKTDQNQQETKEKSGSNEKHKNEQAVTDVKNSNSSDKSIEQSQTLSESSTRKSKYIRQRDPIVPIIESNNYLFAQTGKFQYSYEGGDGTKAFESGQLKEFDDERKGEAVVGGFSYKDKDGNDFMISYTADENGYRPVGAHLPTPPPLPPAIARALLYLATKTTPEPVTKSIDED